MPISHSAAHVRAAIEEAFWMGEPGEGTKAPVPKESLRGATPDGASAAQAVYNSDVCVFPGCCTGHALLLVWSDLVKDTASGFEALIQLVKSLVMTFCASPLRAGVLKAAMEAYKATVASLIVVKLMLPPNHRWNYHHLMLHRLLRVWVVIQALTPAEVYPTQKKQQASFASPVAVIDEKLVVIQALATMMQVIAQWSETLSGRDVTISRIPQAVRQVRAAASRMSKDENADIARIGRVVAKSVAARFDSWVVASHIQLAEVLDPRTCLSVPAEDMLRRCKVFFDPDDEVNIDRVLFPESAVVLPAAAADEDGDGAVNVHAATYSAGVTPLEDELRKYCAILMKVGRSPTLV